MTSNFSESTFPEIGVFAGTSDAKSSEENSENKNKVSEVMSRIMLAVFCVAVGDDGFQNRVERRQVFHSNAIERDFAVL